MILNIAVTLVLLLAGYASMSGMNLVVWALLDSRRWQSGIMAAWLIVNIAGIGYALYRVWM